MTHRPLIDGPLLITTWGEDELWRPGQRLVGQPLLFFYVPSLVKKSATMSTPPTAPAARRLALTFALCVAAAACLTDAAATGTEVELSEDAGTLVVATPGGQGAMILDGVHVGDTLRALGKAGAAQDEKMADVTAADTAQDTKIADVTATAVAHGDQIKAARQVPVGTVCLCNDPAACGCAEPRARSPSAHRLGLRCPLIRCLDGVPRGPHAASGRRHGPPVQLDVAFRQVRGRCATQPPPYPSTHVLARTHIPTCVHRVCGHACARVSSRSGTRCSTG